MQEDNDSNLKEIFLPVIGLHTGKKVNLSFKPAQ